nr:EOG090X05AE [Macrothrix elegans]
MVPTGEENPGTSANAGSEQTPSKSTKTTKSKTPVSKLPLGVEKDSEEYRKLRERNNEAVKKSRTRTKLRTQSTLDKVEKLRNENGKLEDRIEGLKKELELLKELFVSHAGTKSMKRLTEVDLDVLLAEAAPSSKKNKKNATPYTGRDRSIIEKEVKELLARDEPEVVDLETEPQPSTSREPEQTDLSESSLPEEPTNIEQPAIIPAEQILAVEAAVGDDQVTETYAIIDDGTEFDKQLEKATSHLLLEPDWQSIIQICDIICQGDCQPKYAIAAIKKRFYNQNPYVALYGLQVLESVVKNCGAPIHEEVASKAFMDELREMVHKTTNDKVRSKVLELIQTWAFAFRNNSKYTIIQDTLNILKAEGYTFPALRESDAMFVADRAPDWSDGDNCHRCRVQFSVIVRKHHCRACGQVFCGRCTPRSCTLPRFGIEKEVRVCEDCFEKHNPDGRAPQREDSDGSSKASEAKMAEKSRKEEELKLQEQEELELALALSRSEAEIKKDSSKSQPQRTYSSPIKESTPKVTASDIEDPELARYLNRSYWEQKQQQEKETYHREKDQDSSLYPSAPVTIASTNLSPSNSGSKTTEKYQNGETDEVDEFCSTLSSQLDIFVNRMKSNSSRGRSIANDSSVQTLFLNVTAMHTRLLQYIQQQESARAYYEVLQDKLAQARDARAALDALREEHRERIRREAEEAERQRQIQMAQKLEIMRKKKQEYLQYQRQLALQRVQEEEREMQMRMEQQKQMYQLRGQIPMPGMQMPGFPPQAGPYVGPPQQPGAFPQDMGGHPGYHGMPGSGVHPAAPMPGPHPAGGMHQVAPMVANQPTGAAMPGGHAGAPMSGYGPHPGYHPYPQPQMQQPHPGMPHYGGQQQQTASAPAPTPGNYAPAPQMMMMAPPQQLVQPQPQMQQQHPPAQQQQQPAVAELISFD